MAKVFVLRNYTLRFMAWREAPKERDLEVLGSAVAELGGGSAACISHDRAHGDLVELVAIAESSEPLGWLAVNDDRTLRHELVEHEVLVLDDSDTGYRHIETYPAFVLELHVSTDEEPSAAFTAVQSELESYGWKVGPP